MTKHKKQDAQNPGRSNPAKTSDLMSEVTEQFYKWRNLTPKYRTQAAQIVGPEITEHVLLLFQHKLHKEWRDSETHLWFSAWTDRLGVSGCVSVSRVRLGLALWVLQRLGNRRPDGGRICKRLRWQNKNAHWLIASKPSCLRGGAAKCFASESNAKTNKDHKDTTIRGTKVFFTRQYTKWHSCTHARLKMRVLFIQSQHFETRSFDLEDEPKCTSTQRWNEPARIPQSVW